MGWRNTVDVSFRGQVDRNVSKTVPQKGNTIDHHCPLSNIRWKERVKNGPIFCETVAYKTSGSRVQTYLNDSREYENNAGFVTGVFQSSALRVLDIVSDHVALRG